MYGKTHRHLHDNQQYLGNIIEKPITYSGTLMGIPEFVGTGYRGDDVQTTWTEELQMMMSHQSRTSQCTIE